MLFLVFGIAAGLFLMVYALLFDGSDWWLFIGWVMALVSGATIVAKAPPPYCAEAHLAILLEECR